MSDQLGIVNKPPYFDDFDSSKNYSKILFRPGRAIQSRELTQIQSILQNQIASIGDKVISSPIVSGGDFQIAKVKYLKFYYPEDPSFLKGKIAVFGSGTPNSIIKILHVAANTDSYDNNYTIFFEYRDGYELPSVVVLNPLPVVDQAFDATIIDEENLEQTTFTFSLKGVPGYNTLSPADKNADTGLVVYGTGLLARLGAGIFYKKGYVVTTAAQMLGLSTQIQSSGSGKYTNYAPFLQNTRIGLKLLSKYITTEADSSLYDPSAGFYNFAAPGADRLQLVPSLVQITGDSNDDIIELVDVVNGSIRIINPVLNGNNFLQDGDCRGGDKILKPFILDIIGNTLNVNSGRAVVNCTDIEVVENQSVPLVKTTDNKRLFNQAFNDQCLSDAIIVQSNLDNPLMGGVGGTASAFYDYTQVNTNYFGSGKIRKLFSDEAPRLEIVNCDGIRIGCLTLLDIEKNDETSYRLHFNELQSYTDTIATSALFAEACTLSLDGEKIFTIESSVPVTCADTTPGGKKRLVYHVPRGSNVKSVFDADYMITRDFVADIMSGSSIPGWNNGFPTKATVAEFYMDIPDGVFNDNNMTPNVEMFTVLINGKTIPLKSGETNTPHLRINDSRTKVTVVLRSDEYSATAEDNSTKLTIPSAGKCYLITKVRFPEKSSTTPSGSPSATSISHRKKRLREARGVFLQNLSTNRTISLGYSDVYQLISISDTNGSDITSQFLFDDGQRNDRYDHASITLLPGVLPADTARNFTVVFRYFDHEPIAPGFYGPITTNSYGFDANGIAISGFHGLDLNGNQMTLGYNEIPNFLDRISGEVVSLADSIDFRMIRTEEGLIENGASKSSILRGRWFPSPESQSAIEASYKLDLPRIDLLVLREDGTFVLIEGETATNPVPPEYPKDGCVVAEINVPGTVYSSEDFIIKKPPLKVVTLPELNDMQNRIAELEKSLSIQSLENKARVQSAVLKNEFLTGMVIDDFGGHYVGDVSNDEYNCSMDFSKGTLRVPFTTKFIDFVPDTTGYPKTTAAEADYFVMANQNTSGVTLISNNQGTSEASVNPFGLNDWHGYLSLDRPSQMWVDQTTKPIVRNNSRGQNDAWEAGGESVQANGRKNGFGTQWGFWKSLWFGDRLLENSIFEKDRASAKGFPDNINNAAPSRFSRSINTDALFAPNKKTIGNGGFGLTDGKTNRYVDSSLSFFSPENYIIVRGSSLKPSTRFLVYFENMTTPVLTSRVLNITGTTNSDLKSDNNGNIEFVLYIPNGAYITGNKVLKIVENSDTSKPCTASCLYLNNGAGWKTQAEGDDNTVDLEFFPIGRTDVLLKNEKTLYTGNQTTNGIYQKFFIDGSEYPKGLILDKIGLYLSSIDTSIPISIEIRKVNGGKVDTHHILQNSRIDILPQSTGYTNFVFSKPVYLAVGEYALVVRSNSDQYKTHISQRGLVRVDETATASTTSDISAISVFGANGYFGGSSFTKIEDPSTTLRFYIIRKSFNIFNSNQKKAIARIPIVNGSDSTTGFDLVHMCNDNWRTTTGDVVYALSTGENRTISSNTDIEGSDVFNTENNSLLVTVSTTREDVSPIVDIRKLGLLMVKNSISKTIDILQNESETQSFGGALSSSMKYITRRTDLKLAANVLRATVEAVTPSDIELRMYAKVLYEGDLNFDGENYVEMTKIMGSNSVSKNSFNEFVFELDSTSNAKNFVSFATKIIITSNSSDTSTIKIDFYPEIRNLTIVSSLR